jgi:hypothetical protein
MGAWSMEHGEKLGKKCGRDMAEPPMAGPLAVYEDQSPSGDLHVPCTSLPPSSTNLVPASGTSTAAAALLHRRVSRDSRRSRTSSPSPPSSMEAREPRTLGQGLGTSQK